ncbi:YdcF family protein [Pedobacter yonginense]|nr:YdcF family protein [Pedobacter yonginense]
MLTKKQPRRRKLFIATLLVFLFFSNAFIAGKIANWYEADYPLEQKHDVGIVLGGFSGINERTHQISFNWASDRLFQALALYKKGEINKILLSGGNASLLNNKIKEADLVVDYLKLIGIPDSAILFENQSRNTIENAKNSIALIKKYKADAKILVITSAWHIPRAKTIFEKQSKNKIDYYPTNFIGRNSFSIGDFIIPDLGAFGTWELLIKEWIGLAVDRIRS